MKKSRDELILEEIDKYLLKISDKVDKLLDLQLYLNSFKKEIKTRKTNIMVI